MILKVPSNCSVILWKLRGETGGLGIKQGKESVCPSRRWHKGVKNFCVVENKVLSYSYEYVQEVCKTDQNVNTTKQISY